MLPGSSFSIALAGVRTPQYSVPRIECCEADALRLLAWL